MSIYEIADLRKFFNEPDIVRSCAFGLPIVLVRNSFKAWCGYVGVPAHHPHYGLSYGDTLANFDTSKVLVQKQSPISLFLAMAGEGSDISIDCLYNVHGGITYATDHPPLFPRDGHWWFGFDCSHYQDLSPKDIIEAHLENDHWRPGAYRTMEYALAEARSLASQLSDFTSSFPEHF